MWTLIALAASGVSLALIVRHFDRLPDFSTRFLLVAIWLRYVLAAFPEQTAKSIVAGFSLNALSSIAVAGIAVLLVGRDLHRLRHLAPIYAIMAVSILTGVLHGEAKGLINDMVKWLYFIGLSLLVFRAVVLFGVDPVMRAVLCAFVTPLLLQAASVVLGVGKFSDGDGSTSYIGGYIHESPFSQIVLTFFFVASLARWRSPATIVVLSLIGLASLMLANYRTSIIAALPLAGLLAAAAVLHVFGPRRRAAAAVVGGFAALALAPLAGSLLHARVADRFADIGRVIIGFGDLIRPPYLFTLEQREVFTGRVYHWADYINTYLNASTVEHLIGFGPGAWEGSFKFYAHNTFVSYLFEFGAIGLALLVFFLAYNLAVALGGSDPQRALRLAAVQAGLILLNLATMPLWAIEGLICYALVFGTSWALWRTRPAAQRAIAPGEPPEDPLYPALAPRGPHPRLPVGQAARRVRA